MRPVDLGGETKCVGEMRRQRIDNRFDPVCQNSMSSHCIEVIGAYFGDW